jgi:hypothetical protein
METAPFFKPCVYSSPVCCTIMNKVLIGAMCIFCASFDMPFFFTDSNGYHLTKFMFKAHRLLPLLDIKNPAEARFSVD